MAGATGVAVADTVTVPEAVEPSAGAVIVTVGGVEPGCVCDSDRDGGAADLQQGVRHVVHGVALRQQVLRVHHAVQDVGPVRHAGQVDRLAGVGLVVLVAPAHAPAQRLGRVGAVVLRDEAGVRRVRHATDKGVAGNAVILLRARRHHGPERAVRVHLVQGERRQRELVVVRRVEHAGHRQRHAVVLCPHARAGAVVNLLAEGRGSGRRVVRRVDLKGPGPRVPGDVREAQLLRTPPDVPIEIAFVGTSICMSGSVTVAALATGASTSVPRPLSASRAAAIVIRNRLLTAGPPQGFSHTRKRH